MNRPRKIRTLSPFHVEVFYVTDRRGRRSSRKDRALRKAAGRPEDGGGCDKEAREASLTWSFETLIMFAAAAEKLLALPFVLHVAIYQTH